MLNIYYDIVVKIYTQSVSARLLLQVVVSGSTFRLVTVLDPGSPLVECLYHYYPHCLYNFKVYFFYLESKYSLPN
jgi:hypothetical protein